MISDNDEKKIQFTHEYISNKSKKISSKVSLITSLISVLFAFAAIVAIAMVIKFIY